MKYKFQSIQFCNMCQSKSDTHKVLGNRLNKSQGLWPNKKIGISTKIIQCSNCKLNYSNPQPIPINFGDHYEIDVESYWNNDYLNSKTDISQLIKKLKRYISLEKEPLALDIGAGFGKMMNALKNEGFITYGIEPSKPFYDFAIEKNNISEKFLMQKSIESSSFEENKFDFITFGAVLEHLEDPSLSLKKAISWLKPGGIIEIQVPQSNWLTGKIYNLIYKLTFSSYCSNLSPMHEPFHLYEFSLKSFVENGKINNYKVVNHTYAICETFLPKIFDKILKRIMKQTNTGMEIYLLLQKIK